MSTVYDPRMTEDQYLALEELMRKEDCSYKDVKAFLKEHGLNINASDGLGETPLHLAAQLGKAEVVDGLVRDGADVGAKDAIGNTPLHTAVNSAKYHSDTAPEICDTLIKYGADANAVNDNGKTPKSRVELSDNKALQDAFIKNGVQLDTQISGDNKFGDNKVLTDLDLVGVLSSVKDCNLPEFKEYVKDYNLSVNAKHENGVSLLHMVARFGDLEMLQYMINNGADINAVTKDGATIGDAIRNNTNVPEEIKEKMLDFYIRNKRKNIPAELKADLKAQFGKPEVSNEEKAKQARLSWRVDRHETPKEMVQKLGNNLEKNVKYMSGLVAEVKKQKSR